MLLQTKECLGPSKAGRDKEGSSPRGFEGMDPELPNRSSFSTEFSGKDAMGVNFYLFHLFLLILKLFKFFIMSELKGVYNQFYVNLRFFHFVKFGPFNKYEISLTFNFLIYSHMCISECFGQLGTVYKSAWHCIWKIESP